MSDAIWYYVDRNQQRNGPVTAAAVAEAYSFGWIDDNSLVWREGLGAWTALSGHRTEIGITGPPGAPPPVSATYRPPAARGMSRTTGCLLIGVGAVVVGIPILAILAAIALPAYQDYIIRSQVTTAYYEAQALTTQVDGFYDNAGRCPRDGSEVTIPAATPGSTRPPAAISFGEDYAGRCTIEAVVVGGNPRVDGVVAARLTRDEGGVWSCGSDVEPRHLPAACRTP